MRESIKMQITNKFCAVTLIHGFVWVIALCHTAAHGLDVSSLAEAVGEGSRAISDQEVESAEIISGRPKINYGTTNSIKFRFLSPHRTIQRHREWRSIQSDWDREQSKVQLRRISRVKPIGVVVIEDVILT